MKKIFYFALIFLAFLYVYAYCQDEAEAFANSNNGGTAAETTDEPGSSTVVDIVSGERTSGSHHNNAG